MFNSNAEDDEDMLRQIRNLYICSSKLLRTFHYCSTSVVAIGQCLQVIVIIFL